MNTRKKRVIFEQRRNKRFPRWKIKEEDRLRELGDPIWTNFRNGTSWRREYSFSFFLIFVVSSHSKDVVNHEDERQMLFSLEVFFSLPKNRIQPMELSINLIYLLYWHDWKDLSNKRSKKSFTDSRVNHKVIRCFNVPKRIRGKHRHMRKTLLVKKSVKVISSYKKHSVSNLH